MNDFSPLGTDLFGDPIRPRTASPVAERFLISPFSVLSAREGVWQERKRAWLAMGIASELGREGALLYKVDPLKVKGTYDAGDTEGAPVGGSTSIFDPVLTECAYRWWCPPAGQVVDPFAGGSVRGVVASCLGLRYWGGELRAAQVDANRQQALELCAELPPVYVQGDSLETVPGAPEADFLFTCPPYGDLERYSDDPADLSTLDWHGFVRAYRRIIRAACARLRPNRFAAVVVADYRDPKTGQYRDFVSTTISAFREQGLGLYNEAILLTAIGSAAMRVTRQFNGGRKLCKVHQQLLVFVKGDWRAATAALGPVTEEAGNG